MIACGWVKVKILRILEVSSRTGRSYEKNSGGLLL